MDHSCDVRNGKSAGMKVPRGAVLTLSLLDAPVLWLFPICVLPSPFPLLIRHRATTVGSFKCQFNPTHPLSWKIHTVALFHSLSLSVPPTFPFLLSTRISLYLLVSLNFFWTPGLYKKKNNFLTSQSFLWDSSEILRPFRKHLNSVSKTFNKKCGYELKRFIILEQMIIRFITLLTDSIWVCFY